MRWRIGQLAAAVLLPGTGQVLRGHPWIGSAFALAYCGCWHVLLVGFWLLPEQFSLWVPILAACFAGSVWLADVSWTVVIMLRQPAEAAHGEQMDRDLRTAVALILQGAYGRAEEKLRAVIRCKRDSVAAWAHLGWLYRSSGARRRAVRAYRHALWLDDGSRFEPDVRRELEVLATATAKSG